MPADSSSFFAYIGPETIVPVTSFVAAVGGLLLTFGRSITVSVRRGILWLTGKNRGTRNQASSLIEQPTRDHALKKG